MWGSFSSFLIFEQQSQVNIIKDSLKTALETRKLSDYKQFFFHFSKLHTPKLVNLPSLSSPDRFFQFFLASSAKISSAQPTKGGGAKVESLFQVRKMGLKLQVPYMRSCPLSKKSLKGTPPQLSQVKFAKKSSANYFQAFANLFYKWCRVWSRSWSDFSIWSFPDHSSAR